jgi:uncharacterized UPF0146 family protein
LTEEHENVERYSSGRPSSTNPPTYFSKIAHLISKLYLKARKIVEVGVGRSPHTLLQLRSLLSDAEIIATDIDPEAVRELNEMGIKSFIDDLFDPDERIYEGADLIYSIRPPFELIPRLAKLGSRIGADVLIILLSEDAHLSNLSGWERIAENELIVYLLKRSSR